MRIVDLTGQRFSRLLVKQRDNDCKGGVHWLCLCDCGNYTSVLTSNLRKSKSKIPRSGLFMTNSCGCGNFRTRISPAKYVRFDYLASAKSKGLPFDLSEEVFEKLVSSDCDYCGNPPSRPLSPSRIRKNTIHAEFRWNGLDRIDSSEGYTENNVVPCCKTCNELKSDKTREEFLSAIEAIHRWQNR